MPKHDGSPTKAELKAMRAGGSRSKHAQRAEKFAADTWHKSRTPEGDPVLARGAYHIGEWYNRRDGSVTFGLYYYGPAGRLEIGTPDGRQWPSLAAAKAAAADHAARAASGD